MRAQTERLNTARAVGNSGADYLTTGTLAYTSSPYVVAGSTGFYSFMVAEAATVTAVVFKSKGGTTLTLTPTWKDVALPAGSYIPAGFIQGEDAYISSITISGGKLILYVD